MAKNRDIMGYCLYCKNEIYYGDAYTKGENGKLYHPDCYVQEHTFTDDFGTYTTDEFGDTPDE
jgi:hypothetical protein